MKEFVYHLEEYHRGEWVPFLTDKKEQKIAKITEEEAEIMNSQSTYSGIRYVKREDKAKVVKKDKNQETDASNLDELRLEYEKLVGKKPHHMLGEQKLIEAIEEAKNN